MRPPFAVVGGTRGWGTKVIDRLAEDLMAAFPTMKGFSPRNPKYMRTFADRCPDFQIGQQPAAQLAWFHVGMPLSTRLTHALSKRQAAP